jgi:hypothetical protein
LGVVHRVAASGSNAEKLLQMVAGDQAPSADLDMGQIAKVHLAIQLITRWISQASGLIDGGD